MSISKVKKSTILGSAGVVAGATAFSRVLGLLREQVMAFFFGAGLATDAFLTAFRVPNLLRDMFAEGALSAAFVPVFKEKLVNASDKEAFRLADIVITGILVVVGLIVLLGIVAAPAIIYISANGFTANPVKFDLTIDLTRIMFVYLLLVSLSALVMGMLNSFGRFGIPAVAPAMFNIGIVLSVLILYSYFDQPIYTLAIGVIVGGIGQLVMQLPSLLSIGYRFRLSFNFLDDGLKKVIRMLLPMIAGLSAGRVNILVNTLLASFLVEGSISFLSYSYRLMHFPLGVFAVALGTVALPRVSELVARNDMAELRRTFDETIHLNLLVVVPSAVFLALMGREIVDLVFGWGAFTAGDAENTQLALLHYSYGLVGFACVRVIVPFFYAFGDSRTPMKASIATVGVNLALYYPGIKLLSFAGLAAATSVAALVNVGILIYLLPSKGVVFSYGRLALSAVRITVAAFISFHIARFMPINFYKGDSLLISRLIDLLVPLTVAAVLYVIFCFLLRVPQVDRLLRLRSGRTGGD